MGEEKYQDQEDSEVEMLWKSLCCLVRGLWVPADKIGYDRSWKPNQVLKVLNESLNGWKY
jgi:hypothetical protein